MIILTEEYYNTLSRYVKEQFGLYFPPEKQIDLERELISVCPALGAKDLFALVDLINDKQLSTSHLELMVNSLTIGETYFLREKKVFEILEHDVIPSIINNKKNNNNTLTIWSAGCSSGEEVYSIAMIIDSLTFLLHGWKINIIGTDINTKSLQKAGAGIYNQWSFRTTPSYIKEKYFTETGNNDFLISKQLRKNVKFKYVNLADDSISSIFNPGTVDIIFCRNVLMYFNEETRESIIKKYKRILAENGWLILSSSEISNNLHKHFKSVNFTNAILYKKENYYQPETANTKVYPINTIEPIINSINFKISEPAELKSKAVPKTGLPLYSVLIPEKNIIKKAEEIFDRGGFTEVVSLLEKELGESKNYFQSDDLEKAFVLLAKTNANLGRLDEAKKWSKEAITINKINYRTYYLLANILLEADQREEAIASLRNALFIEPNFILASFTLGNIYHKMGKKNEARKHFENASSILSVYSSNETVPESDGLTVSYLREIIKSINN
jgi:chemotaxis protein methyltransferase CheR